MNLTHQLIQWQGDLGQLKGEIGLTIGAVIILTIGLLNVPKWAVKALFGALLLVLIVVWPTQEASLFNGYLARTNLSISLVRIFLGATLLMVLFKENFKENNSYYFLVLCTLLGSILLVQSRHLLLIYLSIELISYASYILTNFSFKKSGNEAAIKYLLFGGVSSAVMLFGISFLYGLNVGLMLEQLKDVSLLGQMGFYLFLSGALFKASLIPFHIWVPNVYQTAPVSTAAFFSIVPKIAGFGLLANWFLIVGFGRDLILILGMLTILLGTFGALRQTNVRRLIAYGAVAHSGFILPLVVLEIDHSLFVMYTLIYALMNLAVFFFIASFEENGLLELRDYEGLGKSNVFLGITFTGVLVSLIGIPPFAGFLAKWFVFISLWEAYDSSSGTSILLAYFLVAIVTTVFALFYYLKAPFNIFLKSPKEATQLNFSGIKSGILAGWTVLLLIIFFFPELVKAMLP